MKIKTLLLLSASALMLASCGENKTPSSSEKGNDSSQVTPSSESQSDEASSSEGEKKDSDTSSGDQGGDEDSSSDSTPTPAEKVNLFYQEGDIQLGVGETALTGGQISYWAGDGGTVSSFTHADGKYSLSYAAAGQWYGVQVFYKLPYSVSGDSYHIETTFHSDTAGSFTINKEVITVEANTDYSYSKDFTTTSGTVISMQLGVNGTSVMGGSLLTFTDPVIKDNGDNKYNKVTFKNGDTMVKEIQVRDGKTVKAPADPTAPEGKIFGGWYDGETKFSPDTVITKAKTYVAKFEDASTAKTVTFKTSDGTILKEAKVAAGGVVTAPSDDEINIFAYRAIGWKTSDGADYDFATPVSADLVLIAKTQINPTTWFDSNDAGYVIPAKHCSITDEGAYKVSDLPSYKNMAYQIQVNFSPIPANETKDYTLSFEYKINGTGGDAQVYSGSTHGTALTLEKSDTFKKGEITFTGPIAAGDKKLTFELGAISDVDNIEFEVKNVAISSK